VHYLDTGSGPILLMLHGNPAWSFVYREVIVALRSRFRCIALDFPGFGLSTGAPEYRYLAQDHAELLVAFLDHLDFSELTLVGHNWGGPFGLYAAEQRPDRFQRLVLANTWAWPLNGDLPVELASRLLGGPVGRELIRRFNLFVNVMIPAGHRLRKPTPDEMAHYRKALATRHRRHASAVFPRRITASRAFLAGVEAGLGDLASLPTLIVWGDADFAFRAKERQRWEQIFADHHTVIVEGAGHFVQSDSPDQFAAAVRAWHADLAEREPSRRPPARPRTPTVP
jgi:haloalkane dehalogenase